MIKCIVVFWLNDILVSATTQQDGSYQKRNVQWKLNVSLLRNFIRILYISFTEFYTLTSLNCMHELHWISYINFTELYALTSLNFIH